MGPEMKACGEAASYLKAAGFELHYASMKSEACYYRWTGRDGLLRVAAHRGGGRRDGLSGVVARITLTPTGLPHSKAGVKMVTAQAIGLFMIATSPPPEEGKGT